MCGSAVRIRRCSSASLGSGTARKRLSTCCSALKLRNPGTTEDAAVDDGCCARRMETKKTRPRTNGERPNRERFMRFPVRTVKLRRLHQYGRAKLRVQEIAGRTFYLEYGFALWATRLVSNQHEKKPSWTGIVHVHDWDVARFAGS